MCGPAGYLLNPVSEAFPSDSLPCFVGMSGLLCSKYCLNVCDERRGNVLFVRLAAAAGPEICPDIKQ